MSGSDIQTDSSEKLELHQDDEAIGVFFKRSMLVIALAGAIALLVYLLSNRSVSDVVVVDSAPIVPTIDNAPEESVPTKVFFKDVTAEASIYFTHENGAYGEKLLPETMGGGLALFDFDNDGLVDILFVDSSQWPRRGTTLESRHKLFKNKGNFSFEDISAQVNLTTANYGQGVAIGDYDSDGFIDIYITGVGRNFLFKNVGGQSFEKQEANVAGDEASWSTSAAFFDYDNDGDLDLFVCNYVEWSKEIDYEVDYQLAGIGRAYGPPTNYKGTHSKLYRNDDGQFTDVSREAGIEVVNVSSGLAVGKGLALRPIDLNNDGLMDVVVANDTVQNFVFMNQGNGRFEERGALMGMAFDNSGNATGAMGIDAARFSGDDDIAVAIGNFANEMTSFYMARGNEVFTDESIGSGIGPHSRRALSFGLFFFDYDLDGRSDLLAANGHVEDEINLVQPSQHHAQPAQLFWNCGEQCRRMFTLLSVEGSGELGKPLVGRGAAAADLDNDGDLDVVLTQAGGPALVLKNQMIEDSYSPINWLSISLRQPGNNGRAIGASVEVIVDGHRQRKLVMPARSYLSQFPMDVHFGLGTVGQAHGRAAGTAIAIVTWPDGGISKYKDLEFDRHHQLAR